MGIQMIITTQEHNHDKISFFQLEIPYEKNGYEPSLYIKKHLNTEFIYFLCNIILKLKEKDDTLMIWDADLVKGVKKYKTSKACSDCDAHDANLSGAEIFNCRNREMKMKMNRFEWS